MIKIIFGHRGTGKTALLARIQEYYKQRQLPCYCLDLDQEIQRRYQMAISEIFHQYGELVFRQYEQATLQSLIVGAQSSDGNQQVVYLAVGGGCDLATINDPAVEKIWLRRHSDHGGRIFLGRPRLEHHLGAMDEYFYRFHQREKKFLHWADRIITLPEGINAPNLIEERILLDLPIPLQADVTLLPENFATQEVFQRLIKHYLRWGIRYFEVRDDLLTPEQMHWALLTIPSTALLFSVRRSDSPLLTLISAPHFAGIWDLAVEVENFSQIIDQWGPPTILSKHLPRNSSEGDDFYLFVRELDNWQEKYPQLWLKAAPEIKNFTHCRQGYQWQCQSQSPGHHLFLPRSPDGRWRWFRCQQGTRPLQFIRTGAGSSLDQPTFFEWCQMRQVQLATLNSGPLKFAAVIGDPVAHSFSPGQHLPFFLERHRCFHAIKMASEEWWEGMNFLLELGLTHAAVTAPLKVLAAQWATDLTSLAQELNAVNTLYLEDNKRVGDNTDLAGFLQLLPPNLPSYPVVIWGGGGTLRMLQQALPHAYTYQARSGQARLPERSLAPLSKVNLVWAAGNHPDTSRPDLFFSVQTIIDLSYTDNSPALALAAQLQIPYYSGLSMFIAQAQEQQQFWRNKEKA